MFEKIKSWIRARRPWMFNNSKIPVWLSKVAPIEIWAVSFGPFVACRGVMSKTTQRHEIIHFQQQLEMFFVFQWIAYGLAYLINLVRYRNGAMAYRENPFEREAYDNDRKYKYLERRPFYNWVKYIY